MSEQIESVREKIIDILRQNAVRGPPFSGQKGEIVGITFLNASKRQKQIKPL